MTLASLATLLAVWAVALASPGPDFVAVTHAAVARSRRDGVLVGLGVTSAIGVWVFASLAGLTVVLTRVQPLYEAVRLAGAVYLAYLSVRILRSLRRKEQAAAAQLADAAPGLRRSPVAAWRSGFLTNIGNPKAAVFFGSIFAALLPAHLGWGYRLGVGAAMLLLAAVWFSTVAGLFSLPRISAAYHRARRAIDAVTGVVFAALAVRVALED
ncbi:LysE family transporter [Streptacidiphilus monticola]|uniref:LysE family transporter n=1 Tax=Streptacidiphilus monticola TaxID=2161674 RepID=A0ABW1G1D8_9ACTN